MTLDEAIKHCEEKAKELKEESEHEKQNQLNKVKMFNGHFPADYTKANSCLECAREHEQLASWLIQLKQVQDIVEHWNDESCSFVSACNAFENILHVFGKGVGDENEND